MVRLSNNQTPTISQRCAICQKEYPKSLDNIRGNASGGDIGRIESPQWAVDSVNKIATDDWRNMAEVMRDNGNLCPDCAGLLNSAISGDNHRRELALLAQTLDSTNSTALDIFDSPTAISIDLDCFLHSTCHSDDNTRESIEPTKSQLQLDAVVDRAIEKLQLENEIQQRLTQLVGINEADFRIFVEKFESLRTSKYFALAIRNNTCVGFWIARVLKGFRKESQLALPVCASTVEYMLDNVTATCTHLVIAPANRTNIRALNYSIIEHNGALVLFDGGDDTAGIELESIT